jgi:uncharacterized membrane protein
MLLAIALKLRNDVLTKTSFALLGVLGVLGIVTFLTGEPAEEAIEHLPGFSEALTEKHEEIALFATIALSVCGAVAAGALLWMRKQVMPRRVAGFVFALSLIAGGMMAYTGWLGGQVGHSEIRNTAVADGDG